MAKHKSAKRARKQPPRGTILKYSLIGLAALLIVFQVAFDRYQFHRNDDAGNLRIATLIVTAIDNLNKPAVIEPVNKRVYLPDANLVMPDSSDLGNVEYSYNPGFDGSDATAQVTLTMARKATSSKVLASGVNGMNGQGESDNLKDIFAAVPNAQACARGLLVDFGAHDGFKTGLVVSKTLADGRTMRVFKESPGCSYNLQPLIDALQLAQSY